MYTVSLQGDSKQYEVQSDGCTYTLTLPKTTVEDSAEYTIVVEDKQASAKLQVDGKYMDDKHEHETPVKHMLMWYLKYNHK